MMRGVVHDDGQPKMRLAACFRPALCSTNGVKTATAMVAVLMTVGCGGDRVEPIAPTPTRASTPQGNETAVAPDIVVEKEELPPSEQTSVVVEPEPPLPRLGSVSHFTWIYKNTSRKQQPIGYVRPGTTVVLDGQEPQGGSDCQSGRWYAVRPKGFVCEDGTVTLDVDSPLFVALTEVVRPREHVLPYRYGYSMGAPMYGRFPSEKEREREAREYGRVDTLSRTEKIKSSYGELAMSDILPATDPVPVFATPELPRLRGYTAALVRKTIPSGSLLSFGSAVESEGRTYLLSPDLTWVPADRVRPFRETTFHGIELGAQVRLPIGWTRSVPRAKMRKLQDGTMEPTGESWPPRTVLSLTGTVHTSQGKRYHETQEGHWIRDTDVSVVEEKTTFPSTIQPGQKWIEFSSSRGTLTLYEGKTAIYSTLASPGRGGGAPSSKMSIEDLVQGSYTPLGTYRITFKTFSTTMTPEAVPNPKKHWIQDVPYTQYFLRPFAIHTAYWHEDFGMPKSGGCINLSPQDARYVFAWTEPVLPQDWSGVSSSPEMGLGTMLVLRR